LDGLGLCYANSTRGPATRTLLPTCTSTAIGLLFKAFPWRLAELKKQIQDMRRCRSMDGTWSFLKTKAKIFFPGRSI
jgi:hypothetical protein